MINENSLWAKREIFSRQSEVRFSNVEVENKYGVTKGIFFKGEPYKKEQTYNFAFLGFPNTPMPSGGYPAVVLMHGGGGSAVHTWVEYWNSKGYAAISTDFYGNQYGMLYGKKIPNPLAGCFEKAGSMNQTKSEFEDSWVYHSVSNIILAFNVLRDSGRVNQSKIALTGISWGSVLTCITSGVDDRFCAFVPVYGGGYVVNTTNFLEYPTAGDKKEWIECYDPISYLPYNSKPTMFTFGADECCFSVVHNQLSADMVKGEVTYAIKQNLFHDMRWRDDDEFCHVAKYLDYIIDKKDMPFSVTYAEISNKTLKVNVNGSKKVKRAKLVYTTNEYGDNMSNKWVWKDIPATQSNEQYFAEIPKDATACYMEFSDQTEEKYKMTEFIQSSKLFLLKEVKIPN